jgi:hypothetical protein
MGRNEDQVLLISDCLAGVFWRVRVYLVCPEAAAAAELAATLITAIARNELFFTSFINLFPANCAVIKRPSRSVVGPGKQKGNSPACCPHTPLHRLQSLSYQSF